MKKWTLVTAVSVALGCSILGGTAGAAEKAPYVLGVVLNMTGPSANIGIAEDRGLRMVVDEVNKAGGVHGRQLKVVLLDAEGKPASAVVQSKRLIDVEKAIALLGYSNSAITLASMETANSGETLMIGGGASEKVWNPTQKWVFNVVPSQKNAMTPFIVDEFSRLGYKNIAYVYLDTAVGQTGLEAFQWSMEKKALKPAIIEKYAPGSTDLSPQLTHVKTSGADALFITGFVDDTALVLKTARDMGITIPIFSDNAIIGPELIQLAGKSVEGVVSTSLKALVAHELPNSDPTKKIAVALYDSYVKQYGPFSLFAGHGWDMTKMTIQALQKVDPKLDPTKDADLKKIRASLRDNVEGIKNFVGQNGTFNYTPDNHNGLGPNTYAPVIVKDGKWIYYKPGMTKAKGG